MNSSEEVESLILLARAMSGETDIIENMEAEGQERVIKNTMMAKDMKPSREAWEQLGFVFTDIPGDDVLCYAVLPEGWSIKKTEDSRWTDIMDEKGMKRGSMFYKAAFYDRRADMGLDCRYRVYSDYSGQDDLTIEVYFGNNIEKLFVAGKIHIPKDSTWQERRDALKEAEKLKAIAEQFAAENYPDWQDIHSYWDSEKEISHGPSK